MKLSIERLQQSSRLFFTDVLGVTSLEEYQDRLLKAIDENDRVLCSACHDVGKTYTLARVALWFASSFPYCKVITTAPTFNQVQNILWAEMRSAHARAKIPLGGRMNLTEWQLDDNWFALGFTPKNEVSAGEGQGTASSFQGFHAAGLIDSPIPTGGVLIIFDEAVGIPANVWTMAEGLMTSARVKFVGIANPTSTASEFYRNFKKGSWYKVKLSCFDSPNLKANGFNNKDDLKVEVAKVKAMGEQQRLDYLKTYKVTRPYLLTTKWVVEKLLEWGFDHPLAKSKIFGEFPEAADDALVTLGQVEESQARHFSTTFREGERRSIGIDVARGGIDDTIITALEGRKQVAKKKMNVRDGKLIAGAAINLASELWGDEGADVIVVDETGVGSSVVDSLSDVCGDNTTPGVRKAVLRPVQFGARLCMTEDDQKKYFNLKARIFDLLANDIKDADGLALIDDSIYGEELTIIKYGYNAKGQMVVESKENFKKRNGGRSPDASDSLALANYGRYDELDVGTFSDEHAGSDAHAPLAMRLNNQRNW